MKKRIATLVSVACWAFAGPAEAVTVDQGVTLITQADALAGGVTPGDAPGYPISITVPGSYRLASNLQATAGADGIKVTAAEVTIDFAGFRLIGGGVAIDGINSNQRALTVRNGTIRAFVTDGIDHAGASLTVENMRLAYNGYYGVDSQNGARILRSTFIGNGMGVRCGSFCHVEGNLIVGNGSYGVTMSGAGMLLRNLIRGNYAAVTASGNVGWGDNAIAENANASSGPLTTMSPNACSPAC